VGGKLAGAGAMTRPVVFGTSYSVYTRVVRLTLEEKAVPYRMEEIDIFAETGPPTGYTERHPFLRIPAFEHEGFQLYETGAITRYVDEVFPNPPLMPDTAEGRARANQIIGILDSYAYRTWVWDIFVERVRIPEKGGASDENKIADALPKAETCLAAIEDLMSDGPFFLGDIVTLADLHAAPMVALFRLAPEGKRLLDDHPRWDAWWQAMSERPSMASTRFAVEK